MSGWTRIWVVFHMILIPVTKWVIVARLCPTLCNPMDCSLSGYSVHGILQARRLRAVVFASFIEILWLKIKSEAQSKSEFSKESACTHAKSLQSCLTLWSMDCRLAGASVHGILQAGILERVFMPFSRQFSLPSDLLCLLHWQAGRFFITSATREVQYRKWIM